MEKRTRLEITQRENRIATYEMEEQLEDSRKIYFDNILDDIVEGKYNDLPMMKEEKNVSVFVDQDKANAARECAKQLGYKSLKQMISTILNEKGIRYYETDEL